MGNLYTYLLENGLNSIELTPFIYSQNNNDVKTDFLNKVNKIDLKSTEQYSNQSVEFKIFDMLRSICLENPELEGILNHKTYVDGVALDDKNVSDNVFFEFKSEDESIKDEKYELKLSKILTNYKDQTEALTKVIENFEPSIKPFLRSKVFKARTKPRNQIFKEVHEMEENVLTPYQIYFLLLHKKEHPTIEVFKDKLDISEYYKEHGETKAYCNNVIEFLEILMEFNFTNVSLVLNGSSIKDCIFNQLFAIEEEVLPKFVLDWIDASPNKKEERIKFLFRLGLNSDESEIVLLRKGLIENDKKIFEKGKVNLTSEKLLLSTLKWIKRKQKKDKTYWLNRELLKDLYEKIGGYSEKKDLLNERLYIPVLKSTIADGYFLKRPKERKFHRNNDLWKTYEKAIFDYLTTKNELVIDDLFPANLDSYIIIESHEPQERGDSDLILDNSKPIDEFDTFFKDWSKIDEVSIRIYDEQQIPVDLFYNEALIKEIKGKTEFLDGSVYYTCLKEKSAIASSLRNILEVDVYNSLFTFINDNKDIDKEKDNNSSISFTEVESEALAKLFGNEIPSEFFKDYNLAACVSALVQLNLQGYDVSKAEIGLKDTHKYSQIEPVISPNDQTTLTFMCRSAIGGILYLRASSWNRLDENDIELFVKTGNKDDQFYLFDQKQAVLQISQTNYQVFRVEAESSMINTKTILEGEFDKDKIWLILKMRDKKEYKSIFEGNIRDIEENPEW